MQGRTERHDREAYPCKPSGEPVSLQMRRTRPYRVGQEMVPTTPAGVQDPSTHALPSSLPDMGSSNKSSSIEHPTSTVSLDPRSERLPYLVDVFMLPLYVAPCQAGAVIKSLNNLTFGSYLWVFSRNSMVMAGDAPGVPTGLHRPRASLVSRKGAKDRSCTCRTMV